MKKPLPVSGNLWPCPGTASAERLAVHPARWSPLFMHTYSLFWKTFISQEVGVPMSVKLQKGHLRRDSQSKHIQLTKRVDGVSSMAGRLESTVLLGYLEDNRIGQWAGCAAELFSKILESFAFFPSALASFWPSSICFRKMVTVLLTSLPKSLSSRHPPHRTRVASS